MTTLFDAIRTSSQHWAKILLVCAGLLSTAAQPALAWGAVGHRAIAHTAERLICSAGKDEVRRLLALEGHKRLVQVASWADKMKGVLGEAGPRHTIRLPLSNEPYDPKRDCRKPNCILTMIPAYAAVLSDTTRSDADRLDALKFLTHLVGDLHQPFHGTAAGERHIVLNGEKQRFHDYWDKGIIAAEKQTTSTLAHAIVKDARALVKRGDASGPITWAQESRDIARDEILPTMTFDSKLVAVVDGPRAATDYVIVKRRLIEASARLAILLNNALGCPAKR